MTPFPSDFAALLSPRGRRILSGRDRHVSDIQASEPGHRFFAFDDAIDRAKARVVLSALDEGLTAHLRPMELAIPPEATWAMTENYSERLPKSVRVKTAMLDARSRGAKVASELGLVTMLRSDAFHRFAEVLAGRPLEKKRGVQVLCYRAGDYSGPHNDHHPEDEEGRDGYFDLHLSLASPEVSQQLIIYEKQGHLNQVQRVAPGPLLTGYKLPFWHQVTPLEAKRGQEAKARRWVLLGTFAYRA